MCSQHAYNCEIITRSRVQLINTSIDTFFSKLRTFLIEQRKRGTPMMVKRELDGAVVESSVGQEICKSDRTVHNF